MPFLSKEGVYREKDQAKQSIRACRRAELVAASPIPASRAVDLSIDGVCVLALGSAMLLPISLIVARDIIPGVRQPCERRFRRTLKATP
jgi:hypothetical protein